MIALGSFGSKVQTSLTPSACQDRANEVVAIPAQANVRAQSMIPSVLGKAGAAHCLFLAKSRPTMYKVPTHATPQMMRSSFQGGLSKVLWLTPQATTAK